MQVFTAKVELISMSSDVSDNNFIIMKMAGHESDLLFLCPNLKEE